MTINLQLKQLLEQESKVSEISTISQIQSRHLETRQQKIVQTIV